jgi:hypothetical protein
MPDDAARPRWNFRYLAVAHCRFIGSVGKYDVWHDTEHVVYNVAIVNSSSYTWAKRNYNGRLVPFNMEGLPFEIECEILRLLKDNNCDQET